MDSPHVIVLFGATGDLSRRKLLPGLLHLYQAELLKECRIIGTSLDDMDDEQFVKFARAACEEFAGDDDLNGKWDEFAAMLSFVPQTDGSKGLADAVKTKEKELEALGEADRL